MFDSKLLRRAMMALSGVALSCSAWAVNVSTPQAAVDQYGTVDVTVSDVDGKLRVRNTDRSILRYKRIARGVYRIKGIRPGEATIRFKDRHSDAEVQVAVSDVLAASAMMVVSPDVASVESGDTAIVRVTNTYGKVRVSNTDRSIIRYKQLREGLYRVRGFDQGEAQLVFEDSRSSGVASITVVAKANDGTRGDERDEDDDGDGHDSGDDNGGSAGGTGTTGSLDGRLLASNCFQCHGTNGSGGFERLTGESASEIYGELKEFASGKEDPNGIMAAHAMGFTDAQMRAIANYFASVR